MSGRVERHSLYKIKYRPDEYCTAFYNTEGVLEEMRIYIQKERGKEDLYCVGLHRTFSLQTFLQENEFEHAGMDIGFEDNQYVYGKMIKYNIIC